MRAPLSRGSTGGSIITSTLSYRQQDDVRRQRFIGSSGAGGGGAAPGAGVGVGVKAPNPRVVYHMYKYLWAVGDREKSLKRFQGFTSMLQGRFKR